MIEKNHSGCCVDDEPLRDEGPQRDERGRRETSGACWNYPRSVEGVWD